MTRGRHIRKIARTLTVPSRIFLVSVLVGSTFVANSQFQPAKAAVNVAVPSPPTSVNATAGTASISLTWAAPAESGGKTITGYQVEHSTDGSNWTVDPTSIASNATSHTITNLTSVARHVRIAAKFATGLGSYGYPWKKIYGTVTPTRTGPTGSITYESNYGLSSSDVAQATYANSSFTRVRYLMKSTYGGSAKYVDADFAKTLNSSTNYTVSGASFSKNLDTVENLRIPSHEGTASFFSVQGNVSDLTVTSDVPSVQDGNGFTGRLEFWPLNYDPGAAIGLDAREDNKYDDSDLPNISNATSNYGSFQLHNITNSGNDYRQTVFAWNRHGVAGQAEIGFGSYSGSRLNLGAHSDWTFCYQEGECGDRTNFSLEIFINPTVTPTQGAALTPSFGTATRTADGFTVQISNYDSAFTWAGTATANGTVAISNTGLVTVSGVAANTASTVTVTTTRIGYTNGSATKTETSLSTVNVGACSAFVSSTSGVSVYDSGTNCYVAFKSTGINYSYLPPSGISSINLLVVAGGGGGATRHAGAGGAGGLLQQQGQSINGSTMSISVGAGGAGSTASPWSGSGYPDASNGSNSVVSGSGITTQTAIGGGRGSVDDAPNVGGSGGGGNGSNGAGANGTVGQGNKGGNGATNNSYWLGGGGGGAGSPGANADGALVKAGNGGAGLAVGWIPASAATALGVGEVSTDQTYFAGGGGAGASTGTAGLGGVGGGGDGRALVTQAAESGSNNTGGGGGATGLDVSGGGSSAGGSGGSGVVVLSYVHSYTVTYAANKDQHQAGVTSGTAPASAIVSSGGSYTVAGQGTLARQGFTFAGWKDQNGNSIAAGSPITVNSDLTLSAQWEIPNSARLFGQTSSGVRKESIIQIKQNGISKAGNIRGIASDGTYVYFRTATGSGQADTVIRQVNLDGTFVADRTITGLPTLAELDLTYSHGCLFIRQSTSIQDKLYCVDVSTWTIHSINLTGGNLYAGKAWLQGNIVDFPDGRIGAVSGNNESVPSCPASMYCKILRLYNVTGTGSGVQVSFDEDIILADSENSWPNDEHGIATDGTYLYQINLQDRGYKVWALESGRPSYLVFNGDGPIGATIASESTYPCGANIGTSNGFCNLIFSKSGLSVTNPTFFTRSHATNQYIIGDFEKNQFIISEVAAPPAGPGTAAEAPVITAQPQGATKSPGDSVTFSVTVSAVTDGGTISYVWKKNGSVISGANSTSLTLSNLIESSAGDYTIEVTNTLGDKTTTTVSSAATLIIRQAQAQTVAVSSASSVTYGSTLTLTGSGGNGTGAYSFTKVSGDCTLSGTNNSTLTPSAATTCVVKTKRAGDSTYLESSFSPDFTVTVNKKPLTLTVKPVNRIYNGQSSVSLKNGAATPVTISKTDLVGVLTDDAANVDIDLNKIQATVSTPDVATGKSVTATVLSGFLTGSKAANYELPTITVASTVDITQASQGSVTFNPASTLTYGGTLNLLATGGDGTGDYEFTKVSGSCTVTGAVVIPTSGTGSCVVKARKAGDTNYQASSYSADKTINLGKATQTINFTSSVPSTPIAGGTYAVTATASSALTITFSSLTTGVCTVAGSTVTFNTSGTCTIKSDQAGNDNYSTATAVTQTIVVGQKNQRITFPAITNKSYGGASFSAGATVDSGLTLSYSSSNPAICTVTPATGVVTPVGVGQCSITVSQSAGNSVYAPASDVVRTFDIDPITPTAPRITSVSFGDSSVTVAYVAPSSNGGANILAYRVVATPISGTQVIKSDCSTSGVCEINGLVNGTSYQVVVAATNAAGTGDVSNTSPAITPATTPDAVTNLATIPGDETLAVSWTAPTSFGGGTFTKYQLVATPRSGSALPTVEITSASTTNYEFTGLANGTAYDVTVTVLSSANTASLASNTTTALGVPATVPGSPRNFTVLELSRTSAFLSWTVPTSNGGSAITTYEVLPAGCTLTNPLDTNCIITGQTPGSTVQFSVVAKNEMGSSAVATASHTFTADPVTETQSPAPQAPVVSTPTSTPSPSTGTSAAPRTTASPRPSSSASVTASASPTPTIKYVAPQSLFPVLADAPYPTGGIEIPNSGEVITVIGGKEVAPVITNTAIDTLIQFPDGSAVTMWSQTTDGQNIPIEPGGSVKVLQGAVLYAEGTGFNPDSPIEAWLFSDPKRLGGGYANADGNFSSQFVIDSETKTGDHTLVLNGVNANEEVLTLALGVTVVDKLDQLAPAGEGQGRSTAVKIAEQLAAISFGLLVFAILYLAIRRRKTSL